MSKIRGLYDHLQFSTDIAWDPDDIPTAVEGATWVDLPLSRLLNNGSSLGLPEALRLDLVTGQRTGAGARQDIGLAFTQDDGDEAAPWYTGLVAADDNSTPVWFRVKFDGIDKERIVGGKRGVNVSVASQLMAVFGDLPVHLVQFEAVAGVATGMYDIYDATAT